MRKNNKIIRYLNIIIIDCSLKIPLKSKILKNLSKKRIIIFTSKKGKIFTCSIAEKYNKLSKPILVVFGSPERGIHEILNENINKIQNSNIFNFFPNQATETVRLEEAILGVLSTLNILSK